MSAPEKTSVVDTIVENDAADAVEVPKKTEEASKLKDEKPSNDEVAAADPTDQAVVDAQKQQPEKPKVCAPIRCFT